MLQHNHHFSAHLHRNSPYTCSEFFPDKIVLCGKLLTRKWAVCGTVAIVDHSGEIFPWHSAQGTIRVSCIPWIFAWTVKGLLWSQEVRSVGLYEKWFCQESVSDAGIPVLHMPRGQWENSSMLQMMKQNQTSEARDSSARKDVSLTQRIAVI